MLWQHVEGVTLVRLGMRAILALASRWRERASIVRAWTSDEGSARAFEIAAQELEDAVRTAADEVLTLHEAARESGYSERRLRELIAAGELPQAGRPGAPRLRRRDLPRKPKSRNRDGYDVRADALALSQRVGKGRT